MTHTSMYRNSEGDEGVENFRWNGTDKRNSAICTLLIHGVPDRESEKYAEKYFLQGKQFFKEKNMRNQKKKDKEIIKKVRKRARSERDSKKLYFHNIC